jgi:N-acetylglucosaminyldiphosphoundecaprenol N-acetyl-beta-D-mannosaminyltransferase
MQRGRVNILGVEVSAINMDQALERMQEWIRRKEQNYVCVTPAHSVMDCYRDPSLRSIFNGSGLTTPDGMAIVWLLRLHGREHVSRVYGPDLMREACRRSVEKGWRHFLYGGEPGVAESLKATLEAQYKGIQIVGTYSPPFGPLSDDQERQVMAAINATRPDVLWVGISSPKQERWMHQHCGKVNASVMVGVGAAFDFLTARKPQAPRWMQRSGLEWLYRFWHEPRRLWPRYSQYPLFVLLAAAQLMGLRRFPSGK